MTQKQIDNLLSRRAELKQIQIMANERLKYVSDESLKNNHSCDHRYPDGRLAKDGWYCAICGCGSQLFADPLISAVDREIIHDDWYQPKKKPKK